MFRLLFTKILLGKKVYSVGTFVVGTYHKVLFVPTVLCVGNHVVKFCWKLAKAEVFYYHESAARALGAFCIICPLSGKCTESVSLYAMQLPHLTTSCRFMESSAAQLLFNRLFYVEQLL